MSLHKSIGLPQAEAVIKFLHCDIIVFRQSTDDQSGSANARFPPLSLAPHPYPCSPSCHAICAGANPGS